MHRGIPTLVRQARASYARSRKVRADPIKSEELRLKSEADRLKAENDVRATLLQGIGGLAILVGIAVTWVQFLANLDLAREGQFTEGFTRAVDQLGSDKLDVRIGGIYALERISRDSERDRGRITEVLTAFVRAS